MNNTKITKSGHVSIKTEYGRGPLYRTALPVFICPSMKEVLKQFGESIEVMDATGTKEVHKSPMDLGHLGIIFSSIMENQCIVKYNRSPRSPNKHDYLSPVNIKLIFEQLDKSKIADCAVTKLKIRIKDAELKNIISEIFPERPPQTDIFYAEFESSKCESEVDKEVWDDVKENRELIDLGFKRTLLHCVKLIDENQTLLIMRRRNRFYYINWNPTEWEIKEGSPYHKSPEEVAGALMENLGKHGFVKKYQTGIENKLILTSMS